jgi:hypothetical protein
MEREMKSLKRSALIALMIAALGGSGVWSTPARADLLQNSPVSRHEKKPKPDPTPTPKPGPREGGADD